MVLVWDYQRRELFVGRVFSLQTLKLCHVTFGSCWAVSEQLSSPQSHPLLYVAWSTALHSHTKRSLFTAASQRGMAYNPR